jgi:ABC-type nitrate/sulfonate/bicarbonate transport system substrate-binding protein
MIKKKMHVVIVSIICIAIVAVIIYASMHSIKSTDNSVFLPVVRVGLPIRSLDASPVMLAYQKGFFRDEGIDVKLMHLQSSEGALAVGSGQVDIDITGAARLFGPIEKGAPIKMLSIISDMPSHLFVRPDSDIVTLKDLEGKKISIGPAGSGGIRLKFVYILTKEGVDTSKIDFIDIEKMYLPMALMDKKTIDAALIDEPAYVDKAKEQNAVALPYWYEKNFQKMPTGSSVAVNTNFLRDNVRSVTQFYKAIIRAHQYMKDNPNETARIVTTYIKDNTNGAMDIKPEEFLKELDEGAVRYILWQDPTPIIEMARVSYTMNLSSRLLTLDELYDLRFQSLLESAQDEVYGASTH